MTTSTIRQEVLRSSDDDLLGLDNEYGFGHGGSAEEHQDLLDSHGQMVSVRRHPLAKAGIGTLAGLHVIAEGAIDACVINWLYRYIKGGPLIGATESFTLANFLTVNGIALAGVLPLEVATILPGYAKWLLYKMATPEDIYKRTEAVIINSFRPLSFAVLSVFAIMAGESMSIPPGVDHSPVTIGKMFALMGLTLAFGGTLTVGNVSNLAYAHMHQRLNASSRPPIKRVFIDDILARRGLLAKLKAMYWRYGAVVGGTVSALTPAAMLGLRRGAVGGIACAGIFGAFGLVTNIMDVAYSYDNNAADTDAKFYSKLAMGLKSALYALPAALTLAKLSYQWDESEYLHQVLNTYVLIAAAAVIMPPVARARYLSSISFVDSQLRKVVYQLRECAPRSWRRDELASDRRCTDGCLSWLGGNRGERAGLLSVQPQQPETRAQYFQNT